MGQQSPPAKSQSLDKDYSLLHTAQDSYDKRVRVNKLLAWTVLILGLLLAAMEILLVTLHATDIVVGTWALLLFMVSSLFALFSLKPRWANQPGQTAVRWLKMATLLQAIGMGLFGLSYLLHVVLP
jgi:hypothetical protein